MTQTEKMDKSAESSSGEAVKSTAEAHRRNVRFTQRFFEEVSREALRVFTLSARRAFESYANAFHVLSSASRSFDPQRLGHFLPLQVHKRAAKGVYSAMIKARQRTDASPDIETLAREQGIQPVASIEGLAADFWPEEDLDEFVTTVRKWRDEDTVLSG